MAHGSSMNNTGTYSIGSYPAGTLQTSHTGTAHRGMTDEEIEKKRLDYEYLQAEHNKRMDALQSHFPRAHQHIANLDIMEDIARENQLNPLYEEVLKDFDAAKVAMSRAANKLASAVKLTDLEEIDLRVRKKLNTQFGNAGFWSAFGNVTSATSASISAAAASATLATTSSGSASGSPSFGGTLSSQIRVYNDLKQDQTKPENKIKESKKLILAKILDFLLGRK